MLTTTMVTVDFEIPTTGGGRMGVVFEGWRIELTAATVGVPMNGDPVTVVAEGARARDGQKVQLTEEELPEGVVDRLKSAAMTKLRAL